MRHLRMWKCIIGMSSVRLWNKAMLWRASTSAFCVSSPWWQPPGTTVDIPSYCSLLRQSERCPFGHSGLLRNRSCRVRVTGRWKSRTAPLQTITAILIDIKKQAFQTFTARHHIIAMTWQLVKNHKIVPVAFILSFGHSGLLVHNFAASLLPSVDGCVSRHSASR